MHRYAEYLKIDRFAELTPATGDSGVSTSASAHAGIVLAFFYPNTLQCLAPLEPPYLVGRYPSPRPLLPFASCAVDLLKSLFVTMVTR